MAEPLRVSERLELPDHELSWRFSRSGGPGGQHVNTNDTRVELTFDVERSPTLPEHLRARVIERIGARLIDGCLTVSASEHRSQTKNRAAAREKMAELLRQATAPPPPARRPTRPSLGARKSRLDDKRRRSETKAQRRKHHDD